MLRFSACRTNLSKLEVKLHVTATENMSADPTHALRFSAALPRATPAPSVPRGDAATVKPSRV